MSVSGDWGKLRKLVGMLRAVPEALYDVTDDATKATDEQYKEDFKGRHDPWGDPWPAHKGKGSPTLMYASGDLYDSKPTKGYLSVRFRPVPRYWVFHQIGANNMHQRAVLPYSSSGWDRPIQRRVFDRVMKHLNTAQ